MIPTRNLSIGRQRAAPASIPAPVGGLNDRDSLAAMPPQDAVILNNWWVLPSKLRVRNGSVDWATGFSTPVNTIVEYSPPSGVSKLFAASGGGIYDITAKGPIGAPVVTGMNSSRFQDASISTVGGNFLYLFNGVDDARLYNGTTWQAVNSGSTPISITGITTSSIIQACVYKNRLWMVENASMNVWYLPVAQVGGAAVKLDLGSVFTRGGYLVGMYSWTIDAGDGADDHAVFLSSNGEVAVYDGTDPSSAATWRIVGLYYLGSPIGRRCAVKYGGDLLILTERGVLPLSSALLSSSIDRRASITDKIQNGIANAVQAAPDNFGWELTIVPQHNAVILNVPTQAGDNYQYVMNSISGAWTKFTGWFANTFRNTSLGLYFGNANSVKQAWEGNSDGNNLIVADGLASFQSFGNGAQNKLFTMVRPFIQTDGKPSVLYAINGDYIPQEPAGTLSYTPPGGMFWGTMIWGSMVWGGQITQLSNWNTVGGVYRAASLRLKVQSNSSNVEWSATSYVYETGGML